MGKERTVKLVFHDHNTAGSFFDWWVDRGADDFHNGHYEKFRCIPVQPSVKLGNRHHES